MGIIKPTTINQLKEIYAQFLLNKTNKVTKLAPGSHLNAHAFGVGKVGQKVLKDIAVLESQIFPESAFGEQLDELALRIGVPARFSELNSSTYILLLGTPATVYDSATLTFTGSHGIVFELVDGDATIPAQGFTYARVQSQTSGAAANVDPNTINIIQPSAPAGHDFITNEYVGMGGRDNEEDDLFRRRIRESVNILASGTLAKYEQVLFNENERVLRLFNGGTDSLGKFLFYVAPVDGGTFSVGEFDAMEAALLPFLSLVESGTGITLANITFVPVDVSMRLTLLDNFVADDVRKDMQVRMQRSLDYRRRLSGLDVESSDLLVIAKRTRGIKKLLDEFFFPDADISIEDGELPRIRSFSFFDLDGVLIASSAGDTPTNFPQQADYVFQQTLIA